jgi:hypothetical protein
MSEIRDAIVAAITSDDEMYFREEDGRIDGRINLDGIVALVESAILAERERCAKIAEEVGIYWDSLRGYEREACFKVADAIRGTSPS